MAVSSSRGEIPSLTGLRGIAALCVVTDHYSVWTSPYDPTDGPLWLMRAVGNSHLGMSLFFTLSGFVIAYNYLGLEWGSRPVASMLRFGWLRFSRLYPALLLFWILMYLRPSDFGPHPGVAYTLMGLSVESLYPVKINGHMVTEPLCWSISTEITLYLFFALMMIAVKKSTPKLGKYAVPVFGGLSFI